MPHTLLASQERSAKWGCDRWYQSQDFGEVLLKSRRLTEFVRQVVAARKFLGLLRRLGRASAVQTLRSLDAPRGGERSADSAHRRACAPQIARTAGRARRRQCAPQGGRTADCANRRQGAPQGWALRRQSVPQGGRSADRTCRRADVPQIAQDAPQ